MRKKFQSMLCFQKGNYQLVKSDYSWWYWNYLTGHSIEDILQIKDIAHICANQSLYSHLERLCKILIKFSTCLSIPNRKIFQIKAINY